VINNSPHCESEEGRTPTQLFADATCEVSVNHWMPFGCPVCKLDSALQKTKKTNKWAERSLIGVHLGFSLQHACAVTPVLDLSTGLGSPQFHVQCNTKFQTAKCSFGDKQQEP